MCSARVESPLIPELRRQPHAQRVPSMPKPSACRRLFASTDDHGETDRFSRDTTAGIDEEQKRKYGFDFTNGRPLLDCGNRSRYTDWVAVPEESVPQFFRSTVARQKPPRSGSRAPTSCSSSLPESSNGEPNHSGSARRSTANIIPSVASGDDTEDSHTFLPVQPDFVDTRQLLSSPDSEPRDVENAKERTSSSSSEPLASTSRTRETQTKMTGYMRHRKRTGSRTGSSSSSASSSDDEGRKRQVPAKRRRWSSSETPSPVTGSS